MPALSDALEMPGLLAMHNAIISSIPPDEMARSLALMLPAMNLEDRVEMLAGMRAGAPAEVFAGVVAIAEASLAPADMEALAIRLTRPRADHDHRASCDDGGGSPGSGTIVGNSTEWTNVEATWGVEVGVPAGCRDAARWACSLRWLCLHVVRGPTTARRRRVRRARRACRRRRPARRRVRRARRRPRARCRRPPGRRPRRQWSSRHLLRSSPGWPCARTSRRSRSIQ